MSGVPGLDDHTMLGRSMAIIDAVADHGSGLALTDLAAVTGIPKPTALRIANSLLRRDMLVRTAFGYALGPALIHLGETAALHRRFEHYRPVLDELHSAYGGFAWLTAGDEIARVRPVAVVCDRRLFPMARTAWPTPGSPEMLANTACGHLALAQHPELLDQLVSVGESWRRTSNSLPDVRALTRAVERVRHDGYAVESEQCATGWSCAAAVVPEVAGTTAVIGVTVELGRAGVGMLRALGRAFDAMLAASTGILPATQ